MCTVTFLPLHNGNFILTSNRDEAINREKALEPVVEVYKNKRLLFPMDETGGGTWIGISEGERAVVLLNGAFERHDRTPPYRHSRGVVVKEVLKADAVLPFLSNFRLDNIEPFTLIIAEWLPHQTLWEFRWDGIAKHLTALNLKPAIWSSTTLYSADMSQLRQKWFNNWLADQNDFFKVDHIRKFHKEAGEGDPISDLLTKRGYLETVSITTIEKTTFGANLLYEDLTTERFSISSFDLQIS